MHKYLFIGLCLLLTIACQSQEGELLKRFEDIKELGNSNPQLALVRLESGRMPIVSNHEACVCALIVTL